MEKQTNFIFFLFIFFFVSTVFTSSEVIEKKNKNGGDDQNQNHNVSVKLFVFGDSYADTGNSAKSFSSWKQPYGITFPGQPAGRFSNGCVLTDYIASFLGIKSPAAYESRKISGLQYGVNFAYGGSGVFNTLISAPNLTTQIDFFEQLLQNKSLYTKQDLESSIALISVAGNDYTTYLFTNGSLKDMPAFTEKVINQIGANLKRLKSLGVRQIAVTGLEPLGCLSALTALDELGNSPVQFHNRMLKEVVKDLNKDSNGRSDVVILDLYKSFLSALKIKHHKGSMKMENQMNLKPCCVGLSSEYSCGNVDDKGVKKYSVCKDPESSFFWDNVHPSQSGWDAVYLFLKSSLHQLHK